MNKAFLGIMLAALAAGGVVGMAMMGVIEIPGLSPAKRAAGAAALYDSDKPGADAASAQGDKQPADAKAGDAKPADTKPSESKTTTAGKAADAAKKDPPPAPKVAEEAPTPPPVKVASANTPAKPAVTVDADLGRKKAAKLWNEMSVDSLAAMVDKYKGADLPRILAIMDVSKVAKVLEKLGPAKAAKLTKDIQREASKVKGTS